MSACFPSPGNEPVFNKDFVAFFVLHTMTLCKMVVSRVGGEIFTVHNFEAEELWDICVEDVYVDRNDFYARWCVGKDLESSDILER